MKRKPAHEMTDDEFEKLIQSTSVKSLKKSREDLAKSIESFSSQHESLREMANTYDGIVANMAEESSVEGTLTRDEEFAEFLQTADVEDLRAAKQEALASLEKLTRQQEALLKSATVLDEQVARQRAVEEQERREQAERIPVVPFPADEETAFSEYEERQPSFLERIIQKIKEFFHIPSAGQSGYYREPNPMVEYGKNQALAPDVPVAS